MEIQSVADLTILSTQFDNIVKPVFGEGSALKTIITSPFPLVPSREKVDRKTEHTASKTFVFTCCGTMDKTLKQYY